MTGTHASAAAPISAFVQIRVVEALSEEASATTAVNPLRLFTNFIPPPSPLPRLVRISFVRTPPPPSSTAMAHGNSRLTHSVHGKFRDRGEIRREIRSANFSAGKPEEEGNLPRSRDSKKCHQFFVTAFRGEDAQIRRHFPRRTCGDVSGSPSNPSKCGSGARLSASVRSASVHRNICILFNLNNKFF